MVTERPVIDHPIELDGRSSDRSMLAVQYGIAVVAALAALALAALR